jgi:hypothetical protein
MPSAESTRVAKRHAHFAVPVLDRWLVHLPLHSVTALVDDAAMQALLVADSGALAWV